MYDDWYLDQVCPLPPEPDELPRVVGRSEAMARGFSRRAIAHRLDTGRWRRVLPRTYLTSDTLTTDDRLAAAVVFAGAGAAVSGTAALWAAGLRRIARPGSVLVVVPDDNRTRSREWVRVQRTSRPVETAPGPGARCVPVARATADTCLTLPRLDDVRALVSRVVQQRLCTVAELGAELELGPRNGSAGLRRALREVGWGAASAPEAGAATILRRAGVGGFIQNATVRLADGSVRVVDFLWPALRACLEIDSVEWHSEHGEWAATWSRHRVLTAAGYSVIHVPPSALARPATFVRDVCEWLTGRADELRIPRADRTW